MFRKVKSADVRLGSIFFSSSAVFNLSATSGGGFNWISA